MKSKVNEEALVFKALGDPNRLLILKLLENGELCACTILEDLEISQSTLSHHMKILEEASLVNANRQGKWMHYTLNGEGIIKAKKRLEKLEQFCLLH